MTKVVLQIRGGRVDYSINDTGTTDSPYGGQKFLLSPPQIQME